jgi:hypothetical protein
MMSVNSPLFADGPEKPRPHLRAVSRHRGRVKPVYGKRLIDEYQGGPQGQNAQPRIPVFVIRNPRVEPNPLLAKKRRMEKEAVRRD